MITIEWRVPLNENDPAEFGPTAREAGIDTNEHGHTLVLIHEDAEWLEFDGDSGVFARFVGADEDTQMNFKGLPVWGVVYTSDAS